MDDEATAHRDADEAHAGRVPTGTGTSRWQKVVGTLGLLVLLIVAIQTASAATGSGGFDHGPDGDRPTETTPGGDSNPHDPSQWDH